MKNMQFTALEEYDWWVDNKLKPFCNIPPNKYKWIVLTSTFTQTNPEYMQYFNHYKLIGVFPMKGIKYMKYAVVLNRKQ